jgi:hypothetical protein
MKAQKNLLWIPAVLAFLWGIVVFFAPESMAKLMKTPAEWINPGLLSWAVTFAVCQICLGVICLWLRTIQDKKTMTGAMTIVALVFLLFGLHGVLQSFIIKGMTKIEIISFIQGIIMFPLAALFFIKRKPAE